MNMLVVQDLFFAHIFKIDNTKLLISGIGGAKCFKYPKKITHLEVI